MMMIVFRLDCIKPYFTYFRMSLETQQTGTCVHLYSDSVTDTINVECSLPVGKMWSACRPTRWGDVVVQVWYMP